MLCGQSVQVHVVVEHSGGEGPEVVEGHGDVGMSQEERESWMAGWMAQGMEVPEIGEDCRGDELDGIARHVPMCVCVMMMRQTMRKQQQRQE